VCAALCTSSIDPSSARFKDLWKALIQGLTVACKANEERKHWPTQGSDDARNGKGERCSWEFWLCCIRNSRVGASSMLIRA